MAFNERFGPLEETLPGAVGSGLNVARVSNYLPDGTMKGRDNQQAPFTRANKFPAHGQCLQSRPGVGFYAVGARNRDDWRGYGIRLDQCRL
jgi:hypothetical protein